MHSLVSSSRYSEKDLFKQRSFSSNYHYKNLQEDTIVYQYFLSNHYFEALNRNIAFLKTMYTYAFFVIPSAEGLVYLAEKYFIKYGIHIQKGNRDSLLGLIESFKSKCPDTPLGILYELEDGKHLCPVIFYYDSTQNQDYIIIFDSIAEDDVCLEIEEEIKENKLNMNLYYSISTRLANDECRTTALINLRNVLLHLKAAPFNRVLQSMAITQTGKIERLPPEWTYTDQVFRSTEDLNAHYVMRDFFSHSPYKRANPRTIAQFRAQKMETCTFKHEGIFLPLFPPPDILRALNNGKPDFEYFSTKQVCTYITKKGFSNASYLHGLFVGKLKEDIALIKEEQAEQITMKYLIKNFT